MVLRVGIQPRPDGGTADTEPSQPLGGALYSGGIAFDGLA